MSVELKQRTQKFALDCWHLCAQIPNSREYNAYVHQLNKSSSSVGANYRAALRGKSSRDFINKLKIVEEEADESAFWLKMFRSILKDNQETLQRLNKEANEIVAIVVASIKTARKNQNL